MCVSDFRECVCVCQQNEKPQAECLRKANMNAQFSSAFQV